MEPEPRVFNTYWRFADERLAAFLRRVRGERAPWSQDPILQEYKFCNTFRAADRVSQDLIRQLYAENAASKADLVFRAIAYRTFSVPATWHRIVQELGRQPRIADLDDGSFGKAVEAARQSQTLYTAAFMLPSPAGAYKASDDNRKHAAHLRQFEDMFLRRELGDRVSSAPSLQDVYEALLGFDMVGEFLAMQMAIDINYSTAVDFSENDFIFPGPGAVRGLAKVFRSLGDSTPQQAIMWMVEHQDEQFERLGLQFPGLWGRKLHAIDCQGLFCETDKYSRVAFPELTSNRVRIKAKFQVTPEPIRLFFPPKWGINDRLPQGPVLGSGQARLEVT